MILRQNLTKLNNIERQLENLLKPIQTLQNIILKSFFTLYLHSTLEEMLYGTN